MVPRSYVYLPLLLLSLLSLFPTPVHALHAAGGAPLILEIEMREPPGSVVFWAKQANITFGTDPRPENYVAVIALEGRSVGFDGVVLSAILF